MKKTIMLAAMAALLSFASCGNTTKGQPTATDSTKTVSDSTETATVETPEQFLKRIYAIVVDDYSAETLHPDISNLDKYVTPEYRKLRKECEEKAAELDETWPVDWDVWTNAQDQQDLQFVGVRKVKDDSDGIVMAVTLKNCGEKSDVYLKMTEHNGKWLVSDFLYNWEGQLISTAVNMYEWLTMQ